MEKQKNNFTQNSQDSGQFHRFQVFQGAKESNGAIKKLKSVGMAYMKEGQTMMSLRLWTFTWERYFILPHRTDSSKYLVMTREPVRNQTHKNKYFWNIVGSGTVHSAQGVIELEFDLLSKSIFVNLHPEKSSHANDLPDPENFDQAA